VDYKEHHILTEYVWENCTNQNPSVLDVIRGYDLQLAQGIR
jgi:hypothetical protein